MALTIPIQFKGVSALFLTIAAIFIAVGPQLQGLYPIYSEIIGFAILVAREYIKDYGTPDTDISTLETEISKLNEDVINLTSTVTSLQNVNLTDEAVTEKS